MIDCIHSLSSNQLNHGRSALPSWNNGHRLSTTKLSLFKIDPVIKVQKELEGRVEVKVIDWAQKKGLKLFHHVRTFIP